MSISLSQTIVEERDENNYTGNSHITPRVMSINESSLRQTDLDPKLKSEREARERVVQQYKNDMLDIILNDTFETGFVSQSEYYISNLCSVENYEYIREAANGLYVEHYDNPHVLTGLLIMMGTLSYKDAEPQGQTIAIGLLHHDDISVRDRAIQAFERWNSKDGLRILKQLHCDRAWLQRYVDKVISYLERDGIDALLV